jgi:polysaccharide biosynthesis transport protein
MILVVVALAAPLCILATSVVLPRAYEASTTLLIRPTTADPFASTMQPSDAVSVATERQILQSATMAGRAAELLGRDDDPADLLDRLTVTAADQDQQVLTLTFEAGDPQLSADYAGAFAEGYLTYRQETAQRLVASTSEAIDSQIATYQSRLDQLPPDEEGGQRVASQRETIQSQINELERRKANMLVRPTSPGEIITPPTVPSSPSGPPLLVSQVGAIGLAALGAIGLAFVVDRSDRRVRGREELTAIAGPVLATVPDPADRPTAVEQAERGEGQGEPYRHLAIRVSSTPRRPLARILLVAPRGGAAADVAATLAVTVAEVGQRSLLVPCEFDSPALGLLSLPELPSFDQVLDQVDIDTTDAGDLAGKAIVPAPPVADLWVASAGPGVTRAEILPRFAGMLAAAAEWFDSVVLSGPPLLDLPHSLELSSAVDGVVIVFDPHLVDRRDLEETVQILADASAPVLGTVVVSSDTIWL